MRNLHRITGATFQHEKPGLCERCTHRTDYGQWQGYCTARRKTLSFHELKLGGKPRCDDFAAAAQEPVAETHQ